MSRKPIAAKPRIAPIVDSPDAENIVITQVVQVITPTYDGQHSMLEAAYLAAGHFIQENAGPEDINLTWNYGGGTFNASYNAPSQAERLRDEDAYSTPVAEDWS